MFNLAGIFNFPTSPRQRKYESKPKLSINPNLVKRKKFLKYKRNQNVFEGILDFLSIPMQHWILQYERTLDTFALHQWVYNEIVSFSTSFKQKSQVGYKQNDLIQQLITQVRQQHSLPLPKFKKPRISLHNIFVLMTQYKVMEKIIQDLNTEQLEMMVDGLSYIYFYGVKEVQNIGEVFSEEDIVTGIGGWGTIDQLTCCIHFITTHTKFYKFYPQKKDYSLMKQIQILKMPSFIKIYDCLQKNKKIDNIVHSIPMFMQFLQIFVRHKNNNFVGCEFIINVKWLGELGERIMEIIHCNISEILLNDQFNRQLTGEQLQIIPQLEDLEEQNEKQVSQIEVKLKQKAILIRQTEGKINPQVLFSYSFHHLYTVNFLIKLTKKVIQLSKCHSTVYKETCKIISKFLLKLFECCQKFQFTLPDTSIQQICEIIKIMSIVDQYQFYGVEEKQVKGYEFLYSKQIGSLKLRQFSKNLQKSERFGCYFHHKLRPKLSSPLEMLGEEVAEDYNVALEQNQQSILYFLLSMIYTMRMDYLSVIYTILKYADKKTLQILQFFFIKNELLHFLVEIQHEIQLKEKVYLKVLYNTLGMLLKGNLVSYAIIDELIDFQTNLNPDKRDFVQDLKTNFSETKELMLIMIADNITVNSKYAKTYSYYPLILKKMLYPREFQLLISESQSYSNHQVWISYIFNIILHELFTFKKKLQEIEYEKRKVELYNYENLVENILFVADKQQKNQLNQEIYDWVTLILFLHIDYVQEKKDRQGLDDDIILRQFVMTTILPNSFKFKHKNESEKMVGLMKTLQDWENYYTNLILSQENNQDVLQKQYCGTIKFLFLKRWNRKIIKALKLFLQSMDDYNLQQREKKKALQKVRSLKNLRK